MAGSGIRRDGRCNGWLADRRGDMVWNALIIVTILLPLASLCIDVPRYFILRARLQAACNAASEGAARAVDVAYFQTTGQTRLDPGQAANNASALFTAGVSSLTGRGYSSSLSGFAIDDAAGTVTVQGTGSMRALFGLTPPFQLHLSSMSWYRMDHR